jgi:hypothetical protein
MIFSYDYKRFSNEPKNFFMNVKTLPDELEDKVYSYMPKSITIFLTKKNYIEGHHLIRSFINRNNIENYIRSMIRQDNDFVFKQLLVENYNRWLNMRKYYYKECIFSNYIYFLESYAIDNESIKCRNLIIDLFQEEGLSKNRHKKNTIRYIRWKT